MSIFNFYMDSGKKVLYIPKIHHFQGEVNVIGSKSIANRVLLLSSFCKDETVLYNVPDSDDVVVLLKTLPELGVDVENVNNHHFKIKGKESYRLKKNHFNLENAGTALRPLIAILSAMNLNQHITIDGNDQMRSRPVMDLILALSEIDVDIHASTKGTPPVKIFSQGWKKNQIYISGKTSSQFISALLLAAPLTKKEIEIFVKDEVVSKPYINITIELMKQFSVEVLNDNYKYFKIPVQEYKSPGEFWIEGDATAATYFYTAGLLSGPVEVKGLTKNSIQGDIKYLDVIEKLGGIVDYKKNSIIVKKGKKISGISIDMNAMPDAAMTLAVTALFCNDYIEIFNVENLRVKESERIKGLASELRKFGAIVEEKKDGLKIFSPSEIIKTIPKIETYRDHRMAMAFSLTSFIRDIEILDPDCVSKTYPGYFTDFESICKL